MHLQSGGIHFQISDFLNGQVVLTNLINQQKKFTNDFTLIQKIQSGEVVADLLEPASSEELALLPPAFQSEINGAIYSESAIRDFVWKFKTVKALEATGLDKIVDAPWVRAELQKIRSQQAFMGIKAYQISTLVNFQKVLQNCKGDYSLLMPQYSKRGGVGVSRLGEAMDFLIETTIDRQIQSNDRIVKSELIQKITAQAQNLVAIGKSMKVPSDSSIARRINQKVAAFGILKSRNGSAAADKEYRQDGPRISAERALELAEWDDIDSGLFLIDERVGLPFGRGYVTHGVDQCTSVPLGYDISPFHRSTSSAINALTSGLMPKNPNSPAFIGVDCDWVGYGFAGINSFDNAVYNHTDELLRVQLNINQSADWVKPYHGAGKSAIEHHNDRVKNSFVCNLDGWKGDSDHPELSKIGIKTAIYDRCAFEKLYVFWTCNVYLNQPGDDGYTPAQRWHRFYSVHKPLVQWTREQVQLMRMRPTTLMPRDSGGLIHLSLRYQSDTLQQLIKHHGKESKIVVYESDDTLDYIVVKHPTTNAIFRVPCVEDERYIRGLLPRQQKLILKQARSQKIKNPSLNDCIKGREELIALTTKLRRDLRLRMRQKGYLNAVPEMPTEKNLSQGEPLHAPRPKEGLMTDLELAIQDLDEIDVSDHDWGADL
jgi:putative transposase